MYEYEDIPTNKFVEVFEFYWSKDAWLGFIPKTSFRKNYKLRLKKFNWYQMLTYYLILVLIAVAQLGILNAFGLIEIPWTEGILDKFLFDDLIKSPK
jgi:hypothetical protein